MAELKNIENIETKFDELKSLIAEVKDNMMKGDDCNNQLYVIMQSLDTISSLVNGIANEKVKPTDEYTILQTNILEVKKELSGMNECVTEVVNNDLKGILSALTEKVNRLEILNNNTGIDQKILIDLSEKAENNKSEITNNIKDCVDYLDKSIKAVSDDALQHISDDITLLSSTYEKTSDNLKRSIIDMLSRVQEAVSKNAQNEYPTKAHNDASGDDIEMLKNGIYNLNANNEQRFSKLNKLIEEMEVFAKLEKFAKLKDLPAIGELRKTLQNKLNEIVEKYSYTLQSSQNQNELDSTTKQFRKDVYNSVISMLGNVSEFLIGEDVSTDVASGTIAEKLDELTSVTELNNSGYNNIQIELEDIRTRCDNIQEYVRKFGDVTGEIKEGVIGLQASNDALRNNNTEVGEVVRECTKSIIENSEPDRKTIKEVLFDIKKNISILQSGDEETDYTYSMQDIESDVAKIRLYLNELAQNGLTVNSEEFSDELNNIVLIVDSIKQQLNKIDEADVSDTLAKMKEDVTSISTRVNKLLLTSDNSYNMIESSLKEFKILSEEIEEQIKSVADSNKFKPLEEGLNSVKKALNESNSYNSVINQSLIMLAEWVDNAGEMITDIHEKQDKLDSIDDLKLLFTQSSDNVVSTVRTMLESIDIPQPVDYSQTLNVIDGKLAEQNLLIEKQDERINKLDEKLATILEFIAKNESGDLVSRMNDIEAKLDKLNTNLEKLTSFVEE